jgi:hypothetical protein
MPIYRVTFARSRVSGAVTTRTISTTKVTAYNLHEAIDKGEDALPTDVYNKGYDRVTVKEVKR